MDESKKDKPNKIILNRSEIDSEQIVLNKFEHWQTDEYAQKTLIKMGYDLRSIKKVIAYIEEDANGNRKVKLQVKTKPISDEPRNIDILLENLKETINSNIYTRKIFNKIIEFKNTIMSKIRK